MSFPRESKQADNVIPPRAGQISVFAVTTAAASQSLAACGPQSNPEGAANTDKPTGAIGRYVTFHAVGGDVYLNFGATAGAVTGANVPDATVTGVNAAKGCAPIFAGTSRDLRPVEGVDLFFGYVTKIGTATLIVEVSSP